ncbi:MAG: hypothetical protein DWI22_01340 [Planctomycetota bacterium]|jgi:hypothetical protein|nr:MAG: hypothetical protein DWI22_01340 [Planctomycetota bacterium]
MQNSLITAILRGLVAELKMPQFPPQCLPDRSVANHALNCNFNTCLKRKFTSIAKNPDDEQPANWVAAIHALSGSMNL